MYFLSEQGVQLESIALNPWELYMIITDFVYKGFSQNTDVDQNFSRYDKLFVLLQGYGHTVKLVSKIWTFDWKKMFQMQHKTILYSDPISSALQVRLNH